jgi:hypothetical protein
MKASKPLRKIFGRSEALKVIGRIPPVLRGLISAKTWQDAAGNDNSRTSLAEAPNPLQQHFDSVVTGKGIWKWLHYFDIYQRHFQRFIGQEVHVVEVGIYSGGSLDMWKEYFGPKCRVYGVDIEEACKAYEDERTRVFIGDQGDRKFWKQFRKQVPHFDIFIDDGGHLPEQQIVTLEETVPYLAPGGVYLCEDIQGTHNPFAAYVRGLATALNNEILKDPADFGGAAAVVRTSNFQRSIHSVHLYPYVAVIEKTRTPVDELASVKHGTLWQPFFDTVAK